MQLEMRTTLGIIPIRSEEKSEPSLEVLDERKNSLPTRGDIRASHK